ncbi:MAG: RNA polymerase sigma-70 factor, partial [Tannerellaceae bacterium]|nr:RNA polymerase sigma-70 factor [Tannerellaceae bacterium]
MEESSDLKQFNHLFESYQSRFVRFANSYVRELAVAEDFTMEAMMYYWERRHSLGEDANIPAYILAIIKNKCL